MGFGGQVVSLGLPRTARYLESAYSAGASRRSARNQGKSAISESLRGGSARTWWAGTRPGRWKHPDLVSWHLARALVFHRVVLVVDTIKLFCG